MCANLLGHKFFSEEEIPVAAGYQIPSTQQHGGGVGVIVDRPEGPRHLTGRPAAQPVSMCHQDTEGLWPLPPSSSQGNCVPKLSPPGPGLVSCRKGNCAHGRRGKVIALKSLSKWVPQGCLSKERQAEWGLDSRTRAASTHPGDGGLQP